MGCAATNFRIAYDFATDRSTLTSFTSEVGNMYATNVQNQQASTVWRSSSLAEQIFVFASDNPEKVDTIIIYNHNLSLNVEIELTIATDVGFTNIVFNKIWDGSNPSIGFGLYPFGLDGFGGYALTDVASELNYFYKYFDSVVGKYFRVHIRNNTNPDGYIQAGKIAVSDSYQPDHNFAKDIKLRRINTSTKNMTEYGTFKVNRGTQLRTISFSLKNATKKDSNIFENIFLNASMDRHLFIDCYQNDNTVFGRRYRMLCKIDTEFNEGYLTHNYQTHDSISLVEDK